MFFLQIISDGFKNKRRNQIVICMFDYRAKVLSEYAYNCKFVSRRFIKQNFYFTADLEVIL